jgi:adenylate kinase family enzyme
LRDKKLIAEIERKLARILFDENRHPNKYEQHISEIYKFLNGDIKKLALSSKGIMINGASGAGKTTLAAEVAKRLGFKHMDLDDYYWPKDADGNNVYTKIQPRDTIISHLRGDLLKHSHFVMSGTVGSILWDFVNPLFNLAVLLLVPPEIRIERVKAREFARYEQRVLTGGDLYEHHQDGYEYNLKYETGFHSVTLERHEKWAEELDCPVLRVDGTKSIAENATWITEQYLSMTKNNVT